MTAPTSRIRRGRELSGLSSLQACRLLGAQLLDLYNWELGHATPTEERIRDMAKVYGVSIAWLNGADPVIPAGTREALRSADISSTEREQLVELLGAIHTPEEPV
jgi:transcriptional regulator with XRE-family HTH domain